MVSDQKELRMIVSSCYLPKRSRSKPQGEDAHLFCPSRQAIIVCDGVGGWAKHGIDSGIYARKLAWNAAAAFKKQPKHDVNPKDALLVAHGNTTAEGSSTACAIALTGAGGNKLRFANVGDSGFQVYRGGQVAVYESRKRQYSFNHPYQLEESKWDASRLVDEGEVEVEAGDIVLAGTDGLFDNLFVWEIEDILQDTRGGSTEDLAWKIASTALSNSKNKNYASPFQKEALLAGKKVRPGGKYDDITVVVAEIGVGAAASAEMESEWKQKRLELKQNLSGSRRDILSLQFNSMIL